MILPKVFEENMKDLFKEDFLSFMKIFEHSPFLGVRSNSLKISNIQLKELLDMETTVVPWCKEGLYLPPTFRAGKSPLYHAGLYYIQEPSAMAPAAIFNVSEGDKVLDLCAAPGGKTTQLAAKLNGKGLLVANDISPSRCIPLAKNLELAGVKNAVITADAPEKLAKRFPFFFDKILLDAPCSGEGMFRKDKETMKEWNEDKPKYFSNIQTDLLSIASQMLANQGEILYSTCTFNKMENENIIETFLLKNPNFSLLPIDHKKYGISEGFGLNECARLLPQNIMGEGHFVAYLKNNSHVDNRIENDINIQFKKPSKEQVKIWEEFSCNHLNFEMIPRFEMVADTLFQTPLLILPLNGIRVFKSGFSLGKFKKNRFEPSQCLAMGLKKSDMKKSIDFKLYDERVNRYLKGESFEADGEEGLNLICLEGFPLGFGKVENGRIKNKYSKSWLMN